VQRTIGSFAPLREILFTYLVKPRLMYNPPMPRPRVRHHTSDEGLDGIRAQGAIHVSRGWGTPLGVHVEVEPFGTTMPEREGRPSPKAELGFERGGAFVEFDLPSAFVVVHYEFPKRHAAIILTNEPLSLEGLNPTFVQVRRYPWEFWRTKAE
jgi:hypothetical protein